MNKHRYVAILAGGLGTRFWPKSRAAFHKQFLDILNTGKTLIQLTFERYAAFIPKENIFIITYK
jgi:mannose-1-phosphate guanylyltransferase